MSSEAKKLQLLENEEETPSPGFFVVHKNILVGGFLSLVTCVIGYYSYEWFYYAKTHISTNNSYVEADIWPVNSRMMGFVKEVYVKENDHVKQGQRLAKLDDVDLDIEMEVKQARFQKASADVNRGRELKKSNIVSPADLETAEAMLAGARADLHATELKRKFTEIVAPADGVVTKHTLHPGQFIQPGQSLMVIVSDQKVWVKANFKETQLEGVKKGMAVEVTVDAYPHETWAGRVESIYPSSGSALSLIPPENATGNFTKVVQRIPVIVSIKPKAGFDLRPGMSTFSTIITK